VVALKRAALQLRCVATTTYTTNLD